MGLAKVSASDENQPVITATELNKTEFSGPDVNAADFNAAEALNLHCPCRTLDTELLHQQLSRVPALATIIQNIDSTHPHLFSATTVFITAAEAAAIANAVKVIEQVLAMPAYQDYVLASAPSIAQANFGPRGVFMGFDFHLSPGGPQLIEINTNAGGAMLNAVLAHAQTACCNTVPTEAVNNELCLLEQAFAAMFAAEWRAQRGDAVMGSLFIIDDDPLQQYLAPEFILFQEMFQRLGVSSSGGIANAKDLSWHGGKLWHGDVVIDMIYNRLTDFYLDAPEHAALRHAYEAGAVVLTPHPRAHALHADKHNLVILSDDKLLESWGVPAQDRELLHAVVPATQKVSADNADYLWAQRKHIFFKPGSAYAGKGVYRGDKLTRKVWAEILEGDFVAQELVAPGQRLIDINGEHSDLKFDLRAYTYKADIQLLAARIYAGQTTNFRTEGGGFAPIEVMP